MAAVGLSLDDERYFGVQLRRPPDRSTPSVRSDRLVPRVLHIGLVGQAPVNGLEFPRGLQL